MTVNAPDAARLVNEITFTSKYQPIRELPELRKLRPNDGLTDQYVRLCTIEPSIQGGRTDFLKALL